MRLHHLLLPFLLLLATACTSVGHHETGIENFDQVSPALFRGAQPNKDGIRTLANYHVQTIINLRDDEDPREPQFAKDAGITYLHLPMDADTITPADATRFLNALASAPTPVFVHCLVGRDRTGLAVAAYRVTVQGWTEQAARLDLYHHGHFWLLYPKVRAALTAIAHTKSPLTPHPAQPPETLLARQSPPRPTP